MSDYTNCLITLGEVEPEDRPMTGKGGNFAGLVDLPPRPQVLAADAPEDAQPASLVLLLLTHDPLVEFAAKVVGLVDEVDGRREVLRVETVFFTAFSPTLPSRYSKSPHLTVLPLLVII